VSDFLIAFTQKGHDKDSSILRSLRYYDDIRAELFEFKKFRVFLSRSDDWSVWGPYTQEDKNVFIALSGRVALDNWVWDQTRRLDGEGGLACKAIYNMYKSKGIESLKNLSGNFVVMIFDGKADKFYIINDRCGMFPCFVGKRRNNELVFCSHPDVLAEFLGSSHDLDVTSLAEFLITGRVSFPYTYYKTIEALDCGCIYTIDLEEEIALCKSKEKYFDFEFMIDPRLSECDLAEELAAVFKKAVNRRISPLFGQSAISLSGGLDARAILCCVSDLDNVCAFTFFDEPNYEYRIAEVIAKEAGVKMFPLKRDFDYYGNAAEMGTRISGGFGSISMNHYLGFRTTLRTSGIGNVISGLYCDYLFKGLLLDKNKNRFTRTEVVSEFRYESYEPYFLLNTLHWNRVRERLDNTFPERLKNDKSDIGRLRIEAKRIFPLCYDLENLVPQRVMPWYLPTIDNELIDLYLKIPPRYKLNVSIFSRVVEMLCNKKFLRIPNSNTGARIGATRINSIVHEYKKAISARIKERISRNIASEDSWPNWEYYICNSKIIESLWVRNNSKFKEIFKSILGNDPYLKSIHEYKGRQNILFLRLLTLKLWFEQRT
jgi:asparagine synthetase B (glutamine-hydrolysing)